MIGSRTPEYAVLSAVRPARAIAWICLRIALIITAFWLVG
jgi:hypothetical protein